MGYFERSFFFQKLFRPFVFFLFIYFFFYFIFLTTDILYTIISTHPFSASPRIEKSIVFCLVYSIIASFFLRFSAYPNLALIHDEYNSRSATRRKEDDKKKKDAIRTFFRLKSN